MTKKLTTPKKVYDDYCFDLVVNGGFFDSKTQRSVSYVTIDGEVVADVENNISLMEQLKEL